MGTNSFPKLLYMYHIRKILSAVVVLRTDHELRPTDGRTERQLSEKNNGFPSQRKEGVVFWRCKWLRCMGGGVAADGSSMIYNLQILHQQSNYITIFECKNVTDVITLQR